MGLAETLKDHQLKTMNFVHAALLRVSGGRIGATTAKMPVFKVTTTGRVSGKPRTVMLTAPVVDGDTLVFVASKGGDDRDPDWYRNLVAHPEITVEAAAGGPAVTMTTRTATQEERATLWPRIVDAYKGYGGYQRRTDRDIPVVIAEPARS